MLGIIPGTDRTYEVFAYIGDETPIEGKLYCDPADDRVYYYSKTEVRSSPATGYYPVWNGTDKFVSDNSNTKYLATDVVSLDPKVISREIDPETAERVIYDQRKSTAGAVLKPQVTDNDNMFTQCIKGTICAKDVTIVDLYDMGCPPLQERMIDNYYASLTKISFMRLEKWNIWVDVILKLKYILKVYRGDELLLTLEHPSDTFTTTDGKQYPKIAKRKCDVFKRAVLILMECANIDKKDLRADHIDDYTVNNMMTMLNGSKAMSSQLFSRFIHMAGLTYTVVMYDDDKLIFEYKE